MKKYVTESETASLKAESNFPMTCISWKSAQKSNIPVFLLNFFQVRPIIENPHLFSLPKPGHSQTQQRKKNIIQIFKAINTFYNT